MLTGAVVWTAPAFCLEWRTLLLHQVRQNERALAGHVLVVADDDRELVQPVTVGNRLGQALDERRAPGVGQDVPGLDHDRTDQDHPLGGAAELPERVVEDCDPS